MLQLYYGANIFKDEIIMKNYLKLDKEGNITGKFKTNDKRQGVVVSDKIFNSIPNSLMIDNEYKYKYINKKVIENNIDINSIKQNKIDNLKIKASNKILNKYPLQEQIFINNLDDDYTNQNKQDMKTYIQNIKTELKNNINNINSITSIEDLNNI